MSKAYFRSPEDLSLILRDLAYSLAAKDRIWLGGSPYAGEFCDVLRRLADRGVAGLTDPDLTLAVAADDETLRTLSPRERSAAFWRYLYDDPDMDLPDKGSAGADLFRRA